jgi:Protein of unknown function DUF262
MLEGPQPFGLKEIASGPRLVAEGVRWYLLDGQQRVTSLYLAALDLGDVVYFVDLLEPDEREEYSFQWARRDRYLPSETRFTVRELLDESTFRARLQGSPSRKFEEYSQARERRMGPLLDDYPIPAIVMSNDIPLEALTRIFETLNRTGVRLDAFDLMVAVLRPHNFMLRDEWQASTETHPNLSVLGVDGVEVLKLIALWQREIDMTSTRPIARKVRGVRQGDVLNIPGAFVQSEWNRAVENYSSAIEILIDRCGIAGNRSIPSWAMVLPMAYWLDGGIEAQLIEKWYWGTAALQTYAQGANTQVIADIGIYPPQIGADQVAAALKSGLEDQSRRNRVLRLALRGLSMRRAREFGSLSRTSSTAGREVSVQLLRQGQIGTTGTDLLVDMIYLPLADIGRLRKTSDHHSSLLEQVDSALLETQGFDRRYLDDASALRSSRVEILSEWMAEVS